MNESRIPIIAGIISAIGASACCTLPLILVSLGAGGAWMGRLSALEPYSPYLTAATFLLLGLAFRRLYFRKAACAPGDACADPRVLRRQRAYFWAVTAVVVALIGFPWIAPLFY